MLCANGKGSHRLKPVVVGNAEKPRALKNIMKNLLVIYEANKSAWSTAEIFSNRFHKHFVPKVRMFQEKKLCIAQENIKALLVLDNAPAHPSME